ncbi:MAG: acid phosphatase [Nitrosomonadales bacterium]|nr:acid phosphatase [Nitrosomonadales bacterium]
MKFALLAALALLAGIPAARATPLPRPDHVVVVIEENRGYAQIMDKRNSDSYIHKLAKQGALFTNSYGIMHPSQPNYLALFSGSTQGVTSNACPLRFDGDNLATVLRKNGLSFASYAESLPATGDLSCMSGAYQRKHNPLANWQGASTPAELNRRFADFPQDFDKLPTVSFVIPDQDNDMHDGSFYMADAWLEKHIAPYVEWAFKHNSLLILTWDEDNYKERNRIVTIMVGPMVKAGRSNQPIDHYNVLRTLLDFYGLPALGYSRDAEPIRDIWRK